MGQEFLYFCQSLLLCQVEKGRESTRSGAAERCPLLLFPQALPEMARPPLFITLCAVAPVVR